MTTIELKGGTVDLKLRGRERAWELMKAGFALYWNPTTAVAVKIKTKSSLIVQGTSEGGGLITRGT